MFKKDFRNVNAAKNTITTTFCTCTILQIIIIRPTNLHTKVIPLLNRNIRHEHTNMYSILCNTDLCEKKRFALNIPFSVDYREIFFY